MDNSPHERLEVSEMKRDALLLRQVHPSFISEGRITSQVFRPTSDSGHHLSVYDAEGIDARASHEHYTGQGRDSAGVVAVTVQECHQLGLSVKPEPLGFSEHHVVIDFGSITASHARKVAQKLAVFARDRGWQFRVDP